MKNKQVKGPGSPEASRAGSLRPAEPSVTGFFPGVNFPIFRGRFGGLGVTDGVRKQEFPGGKPFLRVSPPGSAKRMKKSMAEKDLKRKFALWIRPSLLEKVDSLYESDNCASRSEFMEKALQFYIGYLTCNHAQDYLADVIPSTVKGIMDETANRISRLLFKMAVEQAVTENILAAVCDVDQQDLTRLRGQCIEEIRKTNGMISFEEALRWQRDG